MSSIPCIVVGDAEVNKASLLEQFKTKNIIDDSDISLCENIQEKVYFENQTINLTVYDTSGVDEYEKLRPTIYSRAKVAIICFSLVMPNTLQNVETKWITDIKQYCSDIPFILVGVRSDLRDQFADHHDEFLSKGWEAIPKEKGMEMKEKIGAAEYLECSPLDQDTINNIFETAIKVVLHPPRRGSGIFNFIYQYLGYFWK